MPYIEVETVPEGVEALDLVTREEYDAVVAERDSTIQQRDDALARITEAEKAVRETKAKYADAILNAGTKLQQEPKQDPVVKKPSLAMSADELFGKE